MGCAGREEQQAAPAGGAGSAAADSAAADSAAAASPKREFARLAAQGKVLARKCRRCGRLDLATACFCRGCGNGAFDDAVIEGRGRVATYTIITVPPEGFEEHTPYAWVVLDLDGCDLRMSGFMAGIGSPADLPVGAPARITGYDGRGVVMEAVRQ